MKTPISNGHHLIGLAGYAGSGKDEVGRILCERGFESGPVRKLAFADPLRSKVEIFRGPIGIYRRDNPEGYRTDMQRLGEYYRTKYGADYWVNLLAREYRSLRGSIRNVSFVVTDLRYVNELEWLRSNGGLLWWISRPGTGKVNEHHSEQFYDTLFTSADRVITNSGTLEDLEDVVRYRDRRVDRTSLGDSLYSPAGPGDGED